MKCPVWSVACRFASDGEIVKTVLQTFGQPLDTPPVVRGKPQPFHHVPLQQQFEWCDHKVPLYVQPACIVFLNVPMASHIQTILIICLIVCIKFLWFSTCTRTLILPSIHNMWLLVQFADILFGVPWKDTGLKRYYIRNRQRVISYAVTLVLKKYNAK